MRRGEAIRLLLALTPEGEDALERALYDAHAPFVVCGSVAEAGELERVVARNEPSVVLVSHDLPGLASAHCARLRAWGLRLVGLALDAQAERDLAALGIDALVEPGCPTETLADALASGEADEVVEEQPGRTAAADTASPARSAAVVEVPAEAADPRPSERGTVFAVLGEKGSPGASECAASSGWMMADRHPTVLVEVDGLGGGLDLRLGADPRAGSLLALARAVEAGRPVAELLPRWLVRRPGWPLVLLGPPDLDTTLPELARPGAVTGCLRTLARLFPLVVCDLGWLLSEGGEATLACRVHREALVAADAILLVLGARDEQLRSGLAQLELLLGPLEITFDRIRVCLNGVGQPGVARRSALAATLAQELAERDLALDGVLPWEGRARRRANRTGLPLAAARRHGGYTRALARLLEELFLPASPLPKRRKLRLRVPAAIEEPPDPDQEVPLPWRT